ncbi:MAG: EAL domain-containing protein [Cyanobacteria bacterium P01_C01_bin.147]
MFVLLRLLTTIRSQLMFGFGAILLVSFTSSAIGYRSLAELRNTSQTILQSSARVRELSLELQKNFLAARQAEEIYLNGWKTNITTDDAQTLIRTNQEALSAACENLSELLALEGSTSELSQELALLESLFLNYESAFKATTDRIQNTPHDVFQTRIQRLFQSISKTVGLTSEERNMLWEIAAKEQVYFNSGDPQYLNDARNALKKLATASQQTPTAKGQGDLPSEIQTYLADLNATLLLEQQVQVNTIVANSINREIDRIIQTTEEATQARAQAARLELEQTARQSNIALMATALTALGLTIWASLWLSNRIMRPITALKHAAERVSAGDLDYKLQLPGRDEFSVVAMTFNKMVEQLRHTLADLEFQISERTAALATSHQSLQEKTQSLAIALKQLRESEINYKSLLENLQAGVVVHDHDANILLCNHMASQLLDIPTDQIEGHPTYPTWSFIDEFGQPLAPEKYPVHQVINTLNPLCNYVVGIQKGPDRQPTWVLVSAFPVIDDQQSLQKVVMTFNDITERKLAEESLRHQALHDVLTDLPNRTLLNERLDHALQKVRRNPDYHFAVLFIDLNRFKVINDSLGHTIGDKLLIQVGKILLDCVRSVDTVARLGGDEFVILLDQIQNPQEVIPVVERIETKLQTPMTLMDHTMFTSASIGIAFSHLDYQRGQDILRDADNAMYRAKMKGQSSYEIFDPEMHATALRLLKLETDLRQAIADQAFFLQYQPIVDLASHQLIGFESLVRWRHPERGLVTPNQFIPLAEETGLIIPLGEWILQEACTQMSRWHRELALSNPWQISVNIAAAQFQDALFVKKLDQTLTQAQLPATSLKLEVTESVLLENVDGVLATLTQLKERQIEISLDDFGTGYSSLSYLKQFPIDTLKIDKSFIDHLEHDGDASIVEAIIQISNSLKMKVVAEGVETPTQQAWLQKLGCRVIQGYLISPPLDAAAMNDFTHAFYRQ